MGSDIGWTCVGRDRFLVKRTIYRDCNGVPVASATVNVK